MLYKNYGNLPAHQIAIWIDQNVYKKDCDQYKLFEYLYRLFYQMCQKDKFFNNSLDLDDFSVYAASQLYNRYQKKELDKIKSSLNYARKVLIPYRSQFCIKFYKENLNKDTLNKYDTKYDTDLQFQLAEKACGGISQCEFLIYLNDIARTIEGSIKNIPKKINSSEYENIYISCLLTFIDLATISRYNEEKVDNIKRSNKIKDNLYLFLYKLPKEYKPILYHLNKSYSNYILTLVNKAKIAIKNDLREILYSQVLVENLYGCDLEEDDDYD